MVHFFLWSSISIFRICFPLPKGEAMVTPDQRPSLFLTTQYKLLVLIHTLGD